MNALKVSTKVASAALIILSMLLFSSLNATAKQIGPNPHFYPGTIRVSDSDFNAEIFGNYGTIEISGGGTLTNSGTLSNSYILNNYNGGTLSNSGTLHNRKYLNNYESLNNSGTLSNSGTLFSLYILNNYNGGTLTNSGTLDNYHVLINSGTLTNVGVVSGFGTISQSAGKLINNGTMSQKSFNIQGGMLSGAGTFTGNMTIGSGATVSPGNSPGTLTINGNYVQDGGTLNMELGGLTQGELYDYLNITGTAALGGKLDVDFWNGFIPLGGEEFDLIHAGSISGTFAEFDMPTLTAGLKWEWQYGTTDFWLRVVKGGSNEPVPEPSTYALMAIGLAGLAGLRRKMKK